MKSVKTFVKRPTNDDKFSVLSRENLMGRIEMDLSQEQKTFP